MSARPMIAADIGVAVAIARLQAADRRCGTCKHWRPNSKRDARMNRHYGNCVAPLPAKFPACFDRSLGVRWGVAHSAGDNCTAWEAGGKHGALK